MHRASKRRLASQLDDLQRCYLRLRGDMDAAKLTPAGLAGHSTSLAGALPTAKRKRSSEASLVAPLPAARLSAADDVMDAAASRTGGSAVGPVGSEPGLQEFARMLSTFTRCSKLKV